MDRSDNEARRYQRKGKRRESTEERVSFRQRLPMCVDCYSRCNLKMGKPDDYGPPPLNRSEDKDQLKGGRENASVRVIKRAFSTVRMRKSAP